jgi:hypothetical protein
MEYVGSDQIAKPQKRETVDLTGFNGRWCHLFQLRAPASGSQSVCGESRAQEPNVSRNKATILIDRGGTLDAPSPPGSNRALKAL